MKRIVATGGALAIVLTFAPMLAHAAMADGISPQKCDDYGWHYNPRQSREFIVSTQEPYSTWLQPGQSITYTTKRSNTYSATITAGATSEVGAVLARAQVSLSISVQASYTHESGISVTDTNTSGRAYGVQLGNMGYRIVESRYFVDQHCNISNQHDYVVVAPRPGDVTLGRFY